MRHLIALLTILTACQGIPVADNAQDTLRAPESPEVAREPSCSPNCPRDLYEPYEAFVDRELDGTEVSIAANTRGMYAVWSLDGMSITLTNHDRGRILLSTERGLENYYFRSSTSGALFSAPQTLTVSTEIQSVGIMKVNPPVWIDHETVSVTVCHMRNHVEQRCNTITQVY